MMKPPPSSSSHHGLSAGSKAAASAASAAAAAAAAYESSNEEDVHNHSSKTIIDLIQPSRVKLNHLNLNHQHNLNDVRLEKDSLNVDDSMATMFNKSKILINNYLSLYFSIFLA